MSFSTPPSKKHTITPGAPLKPSHKHAFADIKACKLDFDSPSTPRKLCPNNGMGETWTPPRRITKRRSNTNCPVEKRLPWGARHLQAKLSLINTPRSSTPCSSCKLKFHVSKTVTAFTPCSSFGMSDQATVRELAFFLINRFQLDAAEQRTTTSTTTESGAVFAFVCSENGIRQADYGLSSPQAPTAIAWALEVGCTILEGTGSFSDLCSPPCEGVKQISARCAQSGHEVLLCSVFSELLDCESADCDCTFTFNWHLFDPSTAVGFITDDPSEYAVESHTLYCDCSRAN